MAAHLSLSLWYPHMSLHHLQIGQCVQPTLKINGSCWRNKVSIAKIACRRIWPAEALRSQSLKWAHSSVWHLVARAAKRGDNFICKAVAGEILSQSTFRFFAVSVLPMFSSMFSPVPVMPVETEEVEPVLFQGNGPALS